MMKRFFQFSLLAIFLAYSTMTLASTPVDGKIFYTHPNGNLVTRDVVLEVPSRGQGEVKLKGQNFEWVTTDFKSLNQHGQFIFEANFNVDWMGETSTLKFVGTYIQAKDKILYYGDIYKLKDQSVRHIGGFSFKYDR